MNNYYWDEYINYYVNDDLKKKIVKFHLSSDESIFGMYNPMPIELFEQWKKQLATINYPDTKISTLPFNKLSYELHDIINVLNSYIKNLKEIAFLPIVSIKVDEDLIYNYGIDFSNSEIVLYNIYKSDFMIKNNYNYIISYFQNVDESILLYGSEAYLEIALQIGYIKGSLENWLKKRFTIKNIMEPRQRWTHGLGINPYRELLIGSTCIGKNEK
ncbi:hypothetical protein [Lacrimispora sp.]|uniref:hypothetical protein n=1 Tax=Lacrimispora sp. TaxID=2719234 RepID=UPI002854EBD3|nr:hypothetical protein [Lacrimispora sp.]MDR7811985.1 hypothetical protein [Lacrimispora sp.]